MNYLDWIAILLLLASVGLLVWILKMQQIIRKIQKTLGNIGKPKVLSSPLNKKGRIK